MELCYGVTPRSQSGAYPMSKPSVEKPGNINIRDIPRDLLVKMKMAAALERQSVKELILSLVEQKVQDLEKKGLLPKGK